MSGMKTMRYIGNGCDCTLVDIGEKLLLKKGSIVAKCDNSFLSTETFIQDTLRVAHKFGIVKDCKVIHDIVFSTKAKAAKFILANLTARGTIWKEVSE